MIMIAFRSRACVMQAIRTSAKTNSKTKSTPKPAFDLQVFLDSAGLARQVAEYRKKQTIVPQGDPAKTVLYIQKGGVRLSVVNQAGKEAVVAVFGPGDFLGGPRGSCTVAS
jgi:CRP-like cAMP-binding protein